MLDFKKFHVTVKRCNKPEEEFETLTYVWREYEDVGYGDDIAYYYAHFSFPNYAGEYDMPFYNGEITEQVVSEFYDTPRNYVIEL